MGKLAMGTESALTLQRKIQEELLNRGYSADNDHVMAEYITIMLINDKTPDQINNELTDLIGPEYESNFTEWLFEEASKASDPPPTPIVEQPSPTDSQSHRSGGANLFQSALSGVQSTTGPSARPGSSSGAGHKRTSSARSPSPSSSAPNKARKTDTPTGPRAMMDRPAGHQGHHQNGRSLIERVGHGRRGNYGGGGHAGLSPAQVSQIQAKIDNITGVPMPMMNGQPMPMNGAPGMNFSFQEMMMMNMDLMRQMASSMGIGPGTGMMPMVPGFPFPQPGMQQPQVGPFGPGPQGHQGNQQGPSRGGGPGRGTGRGRGRGGTPSHTQTQPQVTPGPVRVSTPAQITAPSPVPAVPPKPATASTAIPERPSTPSLCKFGLKCTNAQCRYSHPSPVATVESGMVLSTEFCPQGKDCKDKDCKMGHVSPSIVNGAAHKQQTSHPPAPVTATAPAPSPATSPVLCKFGLKCTRPGCMFTHPPNFRAPHMVSSVQCRFGAGCTRGDCPFQHPPGHIPANMFYRGLGSDAPLVEGYVSPHKSVRFSGGDNKATTAAAVAAPTTQGNIESKDDKEVSINKDKTVDVGA